MKTVLICGVSGQDGGYLAKLLLEKGYTVYGASRDAQMSSFSNLKKMGVYEKVHKISVNISDFRSVLQSIQNIKPSEIYNLAGQSSVGLSFEQPVEAIESISLGTLNLLEAIRFSGQAIKFYNAGSSESFGDTGGKIAHENTQFKPSSPYAVAKASAFWQVANYREAYGIFACTGILFNHESPLRPERYVTQKIVSTACRIANGSTEKLLLGNIEIARDWGWAPEYVEAMWMMLQMDHAEDYIIATGKTVKLKYFIEMVFKYLGLDWKNHVEIDTNLLRPTDIMGNYANPQKANLELKWKAKYDVNDVVKFMIEDYKKSL
ncbi:GDP-mannose 4,6-dehydratase [Flavobacterium sp. 120]|uniref:GDP-mannose 4,6-dehydratase n=1 Tax=Flavobacterium sp. 120 TaxID=2135626 RepID=UPI000EAC8F9B|nr:GDP-mannose 4,6-dehydratase [Flavobacterium sp. 120]RKS13307.1 GDPmannose 4,6-dehydratase [Flavobacterium sp. 120]